MEEVLSQGSVPCFGKNEGHLAVRILVRLGCFFFGCTVVKLQQKGPKSL